MRSLATFRRALRNSAGIAVLTLAAAGSPAMAATTVVTTAVGGGVTLLATGDALEVTATGSVTKTPSGTAVGSNLVVSIDHVTIAAGGSITGVGGSAVAIDGGLTTFNNAGTLSGQSNSQAAVDVATDAGTFTNSGSITATGNNGVYIHGNLTGSFLNDVGGTISANSDQTTRVTGTTASFTNKGTITSTNTDTNGGGSVFGGKVTTFLNDTGARIEAKVDGVRLSGGLVTGTNAGTIKSTGAAGTGLLIGQTSTGVATDSGTFTNTGTIEGHDAVVYRDLAKAAIFINGGVITANGGTAIKMTAENDSLTLMTGSTTTGLVDGGGDTGGTGDVLKFDGTGASSLAINNVTHFETLSKAGSGAWTLTGTNAATMTAEINAGSLAINGAMASTFFTVNSGGTLMGSGTTGMVDVKGGGRISPGNSVGTLHTGTITFENNSIYEVEVGAGVADKIIVAGDAFVGTGVTVHLTGAASFCGPTDLDILTTTGGTIQGQLFTLDTLLSGVTLAQDSTSATLSFAGTGTGRTFSGFTSTANQASTAAALDAMGCGNQPYATALNALSDAQVPAAMDALSGEGHAAIAGALIEQSHVLADSVDARIEQAFDALDGSGMASGYADAPMLLGAVDGLTVWGTGYGSFVLRDGDGNASATQSAASGLVLGADGQVSEDWRLGVLGGLGLTGISAGATSGTSLDASIGGYAGAELGVVTVKMGVAYTRHFIETSRSIVFPGVNDVVTASYQAGTAQAFLQFSHDFDVNGLTLTPYAKFQAVNHSTDGFTETGGAGRLTSAASVANAFFVTLGVGAEDKFALTDTMLVTARGGIGWRHAFADALVATNAFAGGGPFSVSAAPIASDVAVLSGGLVFDVSDSLNVAVTYDGEIGSGLMSHSIKATAAGKF